LLARLRQGFLPRDPLYRRESGAGRRAVIAAKLGGGVVVVGAYGFWLVALLAGGRGSLGGETLLTVASCMLCALAFALGMQSVRGEVSDGTAQSLILTPLPRRRIVLSKLAGSAEFLGIAAMLLPLYWLAVEWDGCDDYLMAHLHGGALRFAAVSELWNRQVCPGDFGLVSLATGTAAFASDLSWYGLFACCGLFAATSARTAGGAWARGLALAALVVVALSLVEWLGFDLAGARPPGSTTWWSSLRVGSFVTGVARLDHRDLGEAFQITGQGRPVAWVAAWLAAAVAARLGLAWALLGLTVRRFDRIATD
jgi:hypothetical protein